MSRVKVFRKERYISTGYFAEVNRLGDGKSAEVNDRIAHFGHQVTFEKATEDEVETK